MPHDTWFDTDENRALMAVCTRRQIRGIGVGGVIWGLLNLLVGLAVAQFALINVGIAVLGGLMLGTGVQALRRPTLGILLTETWVTVLLVFWNLGMAVFNMSLGAPLEIRGVILPAVVAATLARQYRKLGPLRELIANIRSDQVATIKSMCKTLLRAKLKKEPMVVAARGGRCRVRLLDDRAFFAQRDLLRSFVCSRNELFGAILKPDAKCWTAEFNHPLGKIRYYYDRRNTDKLRAWLAAAQGSPAIA